MILSRIWWNVYLHRNKNRTFEGFLQLMRESDVKQDEIPLLQSQSLCRVWEMNCTSNIHLQDSRAPYLTRGLVVDARGGFTFKLCGFVVKTPVSLLGC